MTAKSLNEREKAEMDRQLDMELEGTFPASDPLSITRFPRKRRSAEPQRRSAGDRPFHSPRVRD